MTCVYTECVCPREFVCLTVYKMYVLCVFSQVLALVFIRKLLDFFFSKRELSWLDDLMPESKKKKLEDAQQEVLTEPMLLAKSGQSLQTVF